ncbi:MAG: Ycf66 family protein [Hassallia sp.]
MLAYVLALAVGLGSLAIYLAAFFFPEIHRKNDFIWSGVGFFYALVLWVFARRITGGLLLGHVASVALLGWSITQTMSLRRQVTPKTQQTPIPSTEALTNTIQNQASNISLPQRLSQIQKGIGGVFSGVKDKAQQTLNKKTPPTTSAPISKTPVEVVDKRTPVPEQPVVPATVVTTDTEAKSETVPEAIPPHPPAPELVEAAKEAAAVEEAAVAELAKIPLEEIAPDAVLAPPAEEPTDTQLPRN